MNTRQDSAASSWQQAQVVLRVRGPWQAFDLGAALLRRHASAVYPLWIALNLPLLALVLALPAEQRFWGVVLLWWCKPLAEQAVLLCLARAVFGERLGPLAALVAFVRSFSWRSLGALGFRRLSWARGFHAPVTLLEGARGTVRRARLRELGEGTARYALLLTFVLGAIEFYLAVQLVFLLVALLPDLPVNPAEYVPPWLPLVFAPCYVVATVAVGPLYAAAGFALYLDRRCRLEGWDVEVGLRALADRVNAEAGPRRRFGPAVVAIMALLALAPPLPVDAASAMDAMDVDQSKQGSYRAPPPHDAAGARSRAIVRKVLEGPDFHATNIVTYPAVLDSNDDQIEPGELPDWLLDALRAIVDAFWWVLWAAVLASVAYAGWRYRAWLARLLPGAASVEEAPPAAIVVAGVDLAATAVEDSLTRARELLQAGDARAALAMLLRIALRDVLGAGGELRNGDTEQDCLRIAAKVLPTHQADALRELLGCWIPLAYAHRRPDDAHLAALFERMSVAASAGVPA